MQALATCYPISEMCAVWDVPRSSYYHRSRAPEEQALRQALERLATEWPTYGSRRLTAQLHREGWYANRKHIQRLMREMHLVRLKKPRKRRTTQSDHALRRYPNLVQELLVIRPDQVWVADLTYIRLCDEFVYLAVILDVFTRSIRGWQLGRTLDESLTCTALERALRQHQPEIHHSDQGLQYAASHYVERLYAVDTQISMAEVGEATQNGYAERVIRTIKEEEVELSEYRDFHEAYQHIARFIDDVYNRKRIHSSLGYLTPLEFEQQWRAQRKSAAGVLN